MNLLIDTNIALYYLGGDPKLARLLDNESIYISFITEFELQAHPNGTQNESNHLASFLDSITIINIDDDIKKRAIAIRKKFSLKLPDAIIAATAQCRALPLLSADQDFKDVEDLAFLSYQM